MFLRAYEEQAALHWQDWLRLVAMLESVEEMSKVAEADMPHLVALVVNGHPLIDPRVLRARALSLQLLDAGATKARNTLEGPLQISAALRAIADMVGCGRRL